MKIFNPITFIVYQLLVNSTLEFCFQPRDDRIYIKSQEEEDFYKSKYSTLKDFYNFSVQVDKNKTIWVDNDNQFFYESELVNDPDSLHGNRFLQTLMAQQAQDDIPEVKQVVNEDGTTEIVREVKKYIMDGTRLKNLVAGYRGCLLYKGNFMSSDKNYILSEYIVPIEEYVIPLKDIPDQNAKMAFFKNSASIFNQILNTVSLLHEKEFFNDDQNDISIMSSEILLNKIELDDFGYREATQVQKGAIPKGRAIIRYPSNLTSSMSPEVIQKLSEQYGIKNMTYNTNQQKNINYFQIFNLFIETFKILGREKSTSFIVTFQGKPLVFDIKTCFLDRQADDIFEVNKCPIFLLNMLDCLSQKQFEMLYQVMIRHDFNIEPKKVRNILNKMFKFLESWGKRTKLPESYRPDPDYTIYQDINSNIQPKEEEQTENIFVRFFNWIKSLFSSNKDDEDKSKTENENDDKI